MNDRLIALCATLICGGVAGLFGDDLKGAIFLAAFWIVLAMPKDTPPAARRGEE